MAQTYNKMKIDIKEPVTDIITAKQNDSNSRFLDVYLYDGGVPIDLTGHEVRIYMLKADGTEVFNNGEITNATAGRCQFELTDQALGAYGKLLCEITIWYDNVQILTTQTFDIHVVKNLRTAGSIESSNEYGALVVLYQNLYESIDLMTTMVEQFGEPGEVAGEADIATFWQMLEYLYGVTDAALKNASVSEVLERIGLNTDGEDAGTLFGAVNPLSVFLNNFYNTWYNANYRPDDYLILDYDNSVVTTVISTVKSIKNTSETLLHTIVVPENVYTINLTGSCKMSSSSYCGYLYARGSTGSTYLFKGFFNTSYETKTVTLHVTPGDTIKVYWKSDNTSGTFYCNSLIVEMISIKRVLTDEKYKINDVKAKLFVTGSEWLYLDVLPRLDRCDINIAVDDKDSNMNIITFDGVEYLRRCYELLVTVRY